MYFICKHPRLVDAVRANAEVGGDNASRAMPVGMVLGAHEGLGGKHFAVPFAASRWHFTAFHWYLHCLSLAFRCLPLGLPLDPSTAVSLTFPLTFHRLCLDLP